MTDVSPSRDPMSPDPVRWGFGSPGPLRDTLTALALGGGKVVTTSLLADYEIEGHPVEMPGDVAILLDSEERPLALVEAVLSKVIRLADMTDEDAIDEGEGYADAAAFRVAHEDHWNEYIDEVREGIGDPAYAINDDTLIVVERFRIAGLLDPDGEPFDPRVRPAYPADRQHVDAFLAANNAEVVTRLGELVDARRHPALIAEVDDELAGVLTWVLRGRSMEVLTLHVARPWAGVGTALMAAARRVAEASGADRLWLITTHGISIQDEVEFVMTLASSADPVPSVADELRALELAIARRDEAAIPGGYEAVLTADFVEIGASGRRWTRSEILELLQQEPPDPSISIEAFEVSILARDLVLATYDVAVTASDGARRRSRRSSTWLRREGRWQLRFNHGTAIPQDA